ncbi:MAG TPA: FAD-dependent oxidoreductase [Candidatus Acidoferrum sp.]|jgi:glycine oxidase
MKSFDVAIAGGGLIGGAIALELARAGLRVALFERGEPGREASWAGAGILSPAPENPGNIPLVPLGKASLALYPEFVGAVEEISGQKVGFRPRGTLEVLFSSDAASELSTIIALHHGLGLKAEPLRPEDARDLEPSLSAEIAAAVLRPDEASVDNRALTSAVFAAARQSGVEILSGTRVRGIWREGKRCAGLLLENEKVAAQWTVISAGCFSAEIEGAEKYAPVRPAKGQMVALRTDRIKVGNGIKSSESKIDDEIKESEEIKSRDRIRSVGIDACQEMESEVEGKRGDGTKKNEGRGGDGEIKIERVLWSEHVYLVPRNDGRILAGATVEYAGFDKSVTAGSIAKIISGAIQLVPELANARVEETWAGLRPDSPDHLPIIGPTDLEGLLIATGHFRSGILLAPITAQLIREWVTFQNVSVEWDRFSPMRFHRG